MIVNEFFVMICLHIPGTPSFESLCEIDMVDKKDSSGKTTASLNSSMQNLKVHEVKFSISSLDFKFNTWNHVFQIFLSNGCIITFVVSLHTGDVDRVVIDKSLVGKLTGENPSHGR